MNQLQHFLTSSFINEVNDFLHGDKDVWKKNFKKIVISLEDRKKGLLKKFKHIGHTNCEFDSRFIGYPPVTSIDINMNNSPSSAEEADICTRRELLDNDIIKICNIYNKGTMIFYDSGFMIPA